MSVTTPSPKTPLPKVDLGANSFLLIALIVTVCSGSEHRSDKETRERIEKLQETVLRLEKKIDALGATEAPK